MSRIGDLDAALRAAGIPVVGPSLTGPDEAPTEVRVVYLPEATAPQRAQGDALAAGWDWAPRVKRTLLAIRADLVALSTAKKNAVWANLNAGTPPLWATDPGSNAAAIGAYQLLGASLSLSAADILEAKLRAVASYCQDQVSYLVNPSFDPTINIPGDQPVS